MNGIIGPVGLTDMEIRVAEVTIMVAVPEMPSEAAVMVAAPGAMPVTKPILLTLATESSDELQVA
jgi:hypothetical protein